MSEEGPYTMARTRALMSKTDRQHISGESNPSDTQRYQAVSRVRGRIQDELPTDVEILREHHPALFDELRAVVCEEQGDS